MSFLLLSRQSEVPILKAFVHMLVVCIVAVAQAPLWELTKPWLYRLLLLEQMDSQEHRYENHGIHSWGRTSELGLPGSILLKNVQNKTFELLKKLVLIFAFLQDINFSFWHGTNTSPLRISSELESPAFNYHIFWCKICSPFQKKGVPYTSKIYREE